MTDATKLEGAALAEAVARALGWRVFRDGDDEATSTMICMDPDDEIYSFGDYGFRPDRDWEHGGPIIERERIGTSFEEVTGLWHAEFEHGARADGVQRTFASGPTPLIAAMRAFVASKGQA